VNTAMKRGWVGWTVLSVAWVSWYPGVAPGAEPLLMPGKKTLYQRVLSRPGARLASQPGEAGGKPLPGPVSAVRVRAQDRRDGGVALRRRQEPRGQADGWLPAVQGIAWKQQLNRQRRL
jgi:serine/threonine-protein kinase PpkA